MIVRVTRIQLYDFPDCDDLPRIQDKLMDTFNDEQGSTHETSDGDESFIPGEILVIQIVNTKENV